MGHEPYPACLKQLIILSLEVVYRKYNKVYFHYADKLAYIVMHLQWHSN